jgi:hypothetical protein
LVACRERERERERERGQKGERECKKEMMKGGEKRVWESAERGIPTNVRKCTVLPSG